ncbi:MAG: glycosyltransferase family 2 protein [Rhodospirillaceae bacterium]|nr:glycosyltransferase family 2 protein [Rhodospirillales bacterium]
MRTAVNGFTVAGQMHLPGVAVTVSVVIPAHNAEETLARALDSVFAQTLQPFETIVVDDGSRDGTRRIAESYNVRVLSRPMCEGASSARNLGIQAARGQLIAFLDADDEWLPRKLELQLPLFTQRIEFVSCGALLIDTNGVDRGSVYTDRRPVSGENAWRTLLAYNYIATPSVVARRDALLAVGGFDPALPFGEDQDMWIKLSMRGMLGYVDEPLVLVHMSPNSLSGAEIKKQLRVTLPMILRHVDDRRAELTPAQIRTIIGERLTRLGRTALSRCPYGEGAGLLLRAILLPYRPVSNLLLLLRAAPPTQWLKKRLRPLLARPQ